MQAAIQVAVEAAGRPISLLFKAIGGGVFCVFVAWIGAIAALSWRIRSYNAKHGVTGLNAVAGGWTFLLQSPMVVVLLAAAFGIGFYAAVRWTLRQ
jgi:hypothetical protein